MGVKEVVMETLKRSNGELTNGVTSLRANGVLRRLSSPCTNLAATTHTILAWHIATTLCEVHDDPVPPYRRRHSQEQQRRRHVACGLSNYCAYLVAFAPELLPDHSFISKSIFDALVDEATELLKGVKTLEQRCEKLREKGAVAEENDNRLIILGARLANQLMILEIENPMLRWKLLKWYTAIHGLALPLTAFHCNTLIAFYFGRQNAPAAALHLFDAMPDQTPSSWYTAVSGCVHDAAAFHLLRGMRERHVPLSGFALASLVTACERRGWDEGRACGAAIHGLTHRAGLVGNVYIGTALLHLYASRGMVSDVQRLFWEMPERNVVWWTALMVALSSNGYQEEALGAYLHMRREGIVCNANAFATVLSLCGSLDSEMPGLQVASHVVVSGLRNHVSVANSLITMFGSMGRVQDAENLFAQMEERDIVVLT
ncbi:hypothetical protein GUJ93_ZPchr0011g27625 [Zizania palustris]|uniref:Pentatricopeptide repeat-containing protein n=1 Tax=Zizania palustris TaxID=103762 RepID=A0A8J6BR84_ZIZPA|nr:hypothetical protein GUJ93_ZPchr0011g27625 [Zizania palustris]